nr:OSJNBa0070C17.9 [Oryza sativa Japonica Group]
MVPALRRGGGGPRFPQCVAWIQRNQRGDGSWRHAAAAHQQLGSSPEIVTERDLSSTLACVLALARWDAGSEHVRRGLQFIGRNMSVAMDDQTAAPASGSVVSFAAMLRMAMEMGLEVPAVSQADVRDRDAGVICHGGRTEYTAYVSEGLGNIQNWNEVMKFQRKNGSLFNSPYTTAAALVHNYDAKALQYLDMLLDKFGSAVPAAYPANIQSQLYMVDVLEKMGISRHFVGEIKSILDMTYSCWKQRDEEIVLDMQTCGMAFRMLRMNGYDVSSDELSHFSEPSSFHNSLQGYLNDTRSLLELHKASKVSIAEKEVEYALEFPFYTILDRLDHKRNIEHFDITSSQMLETAYLPCHSNEEIMALGVRDFSSSQFIFQEELQQLNSWVKESRLDQLQFARQKLDYFYFSAAATIFTPELSDVRILWAKNGVLTTVVDDFFDVGGSKEELENLVALVEKWDKNDKTEYYSEQVEIVFSAIYTSTNQLGSMASVVQGRDVTKHLVEIVSIISDILWNYFFSEVRTDKLNIVASVNLCIVARIAEVYDDRGRVEAEPHCILLGPKMPDSVIRSQECSELFRLMSKCGRLLNDVQSYEREGSQGKLNSVSLLALHSGGSVSMEEAVKQIQRPIEKCRRELLKLVVSRGGAVPRPCRELFWSMCKVCHFFYSGGDGFSSPTAKAGALDAIPICFVECDEKKKNEEERIVIFWAEKKEKEKEKERVNNKKMVLLLFTWVTGDDGGGAAEVAGATGGLGHLPVAVEGVGGVGEHDPGVLGVKPGVDDAGGLGSNDGGVKPPMGGSGGGWSSGANGVEAKGGVGVGVVVGVEDDGGAFGGLTQYGELEPSPVASARLAASPSGFAGEGDEEGSCIGSTVLMKLSLYSAFSSVFLLLRLIRALASAPSTTTTTTQSNAHQKPN